MIGRLPLLAAALLCAGLLWLGWPGVSMYDTVVQYTQALSGVYDDWHPPVMARLWSLLLPLGGGAAPLLVLQVVTYWAGFGLIAGGLARAGRPRAAAAVIVAGALPLFAAWQIAVLKDTQMLGAMLSAVGLVAWCRLPGQRVPVAAGVGAAVLLAYAMLVRTNAVFAVVPLGVLLLPGRDGWWGRWWGRAFAIGVGVAAVLAVSPAINHRLLAAQVTGVTHTLPLFDLAGIAHFGGAVLTPEDRALIAEKRCYQPFFWDPLGSPSRCGVIAARYEGDRSGALHRAWIDAILLHPVAYARHRLAHLNATLRWIVPAGWTSAAPPAGSEPNNAGLASPAPVARTLAAAGGWMAETALGWPIVWIVVAGIVLAAAQGRRRTPLGDLAVVLAVSALALEASFAVVSIASDLRYHLWPMIASLLAAILLAAEAMPKRRTLYVGIALLAAVIVPGTMARRSLPSPPPGYAAMLDWNDGAPAPQ
ncbi:hypothetical protein [Sphingomonas immobilis]|uniref:Glycosyltransferase RgtA/B/C/D-like domain-containing protein n=1 Tax=Sphingomonas immobilis TaxID=3063997 RepID=A0ABT9A3I4_9SPHN|nr:hypothetical protein [Sphingomonas sp. CA1-15]MDO7844411.1 hypothetical protein [Sphingomonas sp. CA1-15]